MIGGIIRYNFESRQIKNNSVKIWFKLVLRFQRIFKLKCKKLKRKQLCFRSQTFNFW